MKTILLFAVALFITITAYPQLVLYEDDFESYPAGSAMAVNNPEWWATWTNTPGSGEDCFVSTSFAHSGTQSLFITPDNGVTDALFLLGDKVSGAFELEWKVYLESGYGAYYNIQHFEAPGVEWAFDVYFYDGGTGKLTTGNNVYYFSFPMETWFSVRHIFNIDADQATLYIDDEAVHSWPFHYQMYSTEGTNQLGAVNFNDGPNFRYYVDDLEYDTLQITGIRNTDVSPGANSVSIYPNPATDQISVASSEEITEVEILNQSGQSIYKQVAGKNTLNLNLSNYRSGIYLMKVKSENGMSTHKFVVR